MSNLFADVLIIGGGIAGTSVGASLASEIKVILVEAEEHLGFHSTGRSVAVYAPAYGSNIIRKLTSESSILFTRVEQKLSQPILSPRGFLFIGRKNQSQAMATLHEELSKLSSLTSMNLQEAQAMVPAIRSEYLEKALYDPEAKDIDVSSLHNYYINELRSYGGKLLLSQRVHEIKKTGSSYEVICNSIKINCKKIINASGAWADEIGQLAGCKKLDLKPLRRTAFSFQPDNWAYKHWPVVIDCEENFYIKPETGSIIGSPADEKVDIPRDVYAEEIDIAIGMDRIKAALNFKVHSVNSSWAGLRTFSPDREPAVGFDPQDESFFWLAGQGGYGIQTAPYLGRFAADLVLEKNIIPSSKEACLKSELDPSRFYTTK